MTAWAMIEMAIKGRDFLTPAGSGPVGLRPRVVRNLGVAEVLFSNTYLEPRCVDARNEKD